MKFSLTFENIPDNSQRKTRVKIMFIKIDTFSFFKKYVNFLKQTVPGCDIEWPKFCRATNKLDQLRNQSFAEVFPEWWALLEPHWVK